MSHLATHPRAGNVGEKSHIPQPGVGIWEGWGRQGAPRGKRRVSGGQVGTKHSPRPAVLRHSANARLCSSFQFQLSD